MYLELSLKYTSRDNMVKYLVSIQLREIGNIDNNLMNIVDEYNNLDQFVINLFIFYII